MPSLIKECISAIMEAVTSYFNVYGEEKAKIGTPFRKNEQVHLDITGHIGLSGRKKGSLYVTCSNEMLRELVKQVSGMDAAEEEDILDMSGELANTLSGNLQSVFGRDFTVSTPHVLSGDISDHHLHQSGPAYVIPVSWMNHRFFIVIHIQ